MSEDNIKRPFELTVRRGRTCWHRATEVCREDRTVTCKTCAAELDPIEVLLMMAHHRERIMFEIKRLEAERDRARAELEDLKKDVRNAKARIRRRAPKGEAAPPAIKFPPLEPVREKP